MQPVPPLRSFRFSHMQQRWDDGNLLSLREGAASTAPPQIRGRNTTKYHALFLLALLATLPMLLIVSNHLYSSSSTTTTSRLASPPRLGNSAMPVASEKLPYHHLNYEDLEDLFKNSIVFKSQVLDRMQQQNRELIWGLPTSSSSATSSSSPSTVDDDVIAYVITITKCSDEPLWDGAAVLARTILLNSKDNPFSGSNYRAKLYAIIHEDAAACANLYERAGYELVVKPIPVTQDQIPALGYFTANVNSRCDSMKDYMQLWAYTFTQHKIVVLVDVASYMIQPVDELYDAMLLQGDLGLEARKKIEFHWRQMGEPNTTLVDYFIARASTLPERIDAFFTRDYTAVITLEQARQQRNGIMDGFIVIRPNMTHFDELTNMIRGGGGWTTNVGGWYDQGFGGYPGAMCTDGLLSAFYTLFHNESYVELNRCVYNCLADADKTRVVIPDKEDKVEVCRDGRAGCQDCRSQSLADMKTVNLNLCRRPWSCFYLNEELKVHRLCRAMVHEWFQLRRIVEIEWSHKYVGYTPSTGNGTIGSLFFEGYCNSWGVDGYIPMALP